MATKMIPGQYLAIDAVATQGGNPGGVFMQPCVWTNNADTIGINGVTCTSPINPGETDTRCSVFVPNTTNVFGTFQVTCTSGNLSASCDVEVVDPSTIADGMILVPGNPQ